MSTRPPVPDIPVFGPDEQRTVNAFVVQSTKALAEANAALRKAGVAEVATPSATAHMLKLVKKAQADCQQSS